MTQVQTLTVAADEVAKNEGAPIADVREVVDRGSAAVHADVFSRRVERCEFLHRTRKCIKKFQSHCKRDGE